MPLKAPKTIECCHHCVAPKRHTACWGHCPEYAKEKAEYEARKAAYYGDPIVKNGLDAHRSAYIEKALRRRGKTNYVGKAE